MYLVGQGLYGKIQFSDGKFPQYDRAYLIVIVSDNNIGVLNISSVEGKEHKLLFPYNKEIKKHFPPFLLKSFIKLDSLVYISIAEAQKTRVLAAGNTLDKEELNSILSAMIR